MMDSNRKIRFVAWLLSLSLLVSAGVFFPSGPLFNQSDDAVSAATSSEPPRDPAPKPAPKPTPAPAPEPVPTPVADPTPVVQPEPVSVVNSDYRTTPSPWAEGSFREAEKIGLMLSWINTNYNQPMTRLEFARLIVEYYETQMGSIVLSSTSSPFSDTSSVYALKARQAGLMMGIGSGLFGAEATLTRQEAAVVLFRTHQVLFPGSIVPMNDVVFEDASQIAPWAKEAIDFLYTSDILHGIAPQVIDPRGLSTKEQAVALVINMHIRAQAANATTVPTANSPSMDGGGGVANLPGPSSDDHDDDDDEYDDDELDDD